MREAEWAEKVARLEIEVARQKTLIGELVRERDELDNLLCWVTALAYAGESDPHGDPHRVFDPAYIRRMQLQQLLAAGGYGPGRVGVHIEPKRGSI